MGRTRIRVHVTQLQHVELIARATQRMEQTAHSLRTFNYGHGLMEARDLIREVETDARTHQYEPGM